MGIFDFFKNKGKDTQKELTLEDCIIKMFASADIEPHREGTLSFHSKCKVNIVYLMLR